MNNEEFEYIIKKLQEKGTTSITIFLNKEVRMPIANEDLENISIDHNICNAGNYYFPVSNVILIVDNTAELEKIMGDMDDFEKFAEMLKEMRKK